MDTFVLSAGLSSLRFATCSIGVMPVPPAIRPISSYAFSVIGSFMIGPLKSTICPRRSEPRYFESLPSGYALITSSR